MDPNDFLDQCLDDYDLKMEDLYHSAKSVAELKMSHEAIKEEILEDLPQKWRKSIGTSPPPDTVASKLVQKMDSQFQKLQRLYEKSKEREESQFSALTAGKDSISDYNEEMDKYFQNHPNASPKEVEMHHGSVFVKTLIYAKTKNNGPLSSDVRLALDKGLELRRKFYYQKAEIILKANKDPAIGIDLGTTNCCVMVFYRGKCELIPNLSQGSARTTPSYIAFMENGKDTFGHVAKEQAYKYPETTIYDAKRMIGRASNDTELRADKSTWPFEVVDDNGIVKIRVRNKLCYPFEVSARLLKRFRLMADDHLNLPLGSITKAVITVPAYFTEPQRRATHEAPICAGLEVLSILSEPTAAALAYSWERHDDRPRNVLVYDLGGGTFDVAIATVKQSDVTVLCVDGDTHLGGQDFDNALLEYCVNEFENQEGINLAANRNSPDKKLRADSRSALSRLKLQCEKVKERLATTDNTTVDIQGIMGPKNMSIPITRTQLERMVRNHIRNTLDIVDNAIAEAKTKGIAGKQELDDIILIGGSTRMPLVVEMLTDYFEGKQLCKHINPDEAVAYGAAIHAAILNKTEGVKKISVQDVIPISIGTNIKGDKFSVLIPKNSKIPTSATRSYVTVNDNQKLMGFDIFQGENTECCGNKFLGTFDLTGLQQKPAGEEVVITTTTIDANGILKVSAVSEGTGSTNSIKITADRLDFDKDASDRVKAECKKILSL